MEIMEFLTIFGLLDIPTAIVAVVMLFVGWNLPQPAWAKYVQDKVVGFFGGLWNKAKGE